MIRDSELAPLETGHTVFDFSRFKRSLGIPSDRNVAISDEAKTRLSYMLQNYSLDDWKYYLRWKTLLAFNAYLPSVFHLNYPRPTVAATSHETLPPIDPSLRLLMNTMPDALHAFYLKRAIPPQRIAQLQSAFMQTRYALREHLATRRWLSEATRRVALQKLATMKVFLARPERWVDYSDLIINPTTLIENVKRAAHFNLARQISLIGQAKELGRERWTQDSPELYYQPESNSVVIGPTIVQSILLGTPQNLAHTLGGLGSLLAHEMLHAFDIPDNQENKPPHWPNTKQWLQPNEAHHYLAMVNRQLHYVKTLVQQDYGISVNQPRWIGEDFADIGSAAVALRALRRAQGHLSTDSAKRFFQAFALARREKRSIKDERLAAQYEGWAGKYRINGVVSNMPEFIQAYGCTEGDQMVRPDNMRISVW